MATLIRLKALIIKEFLATTREPTARMSLIVPPIVQLLVFAFAATLEVSRIDMKILNQDGGQWSRELVQRIERSPSFRSVLHIHGTEELEQTILMQEAIAVVQIGSIFSRDIASGTPTQVQIVLDGRKSNASQIVFGYLNRIVHNLAAEISPQTSRPTFKVETVTQNRFNLNLDDHWYMVPSLVAVIALLTGLTITALSIARERELGTYDQFMVSPLRPWEILLGKVIPPMVICLCHITMFVVVAVYFFNVPFRGSLLLFYGSSLFFVFSVVSIGLLISTLASTQQQGVLGAFVFMAPAMVLSGFITPIESLPTWLRIITYVNPMRYFLYIIKGVFLKDMSFWPVATNTLPMFMTGVVGMIVAGWLFQRRIE